MAHFYDQRKVGDVGFKGFRRSSDLSKLLACLDELISHNILIPQKSLFLDMGCADGRVSVFFSYLVKVSAGIEIDEWTLDEYDTLRKDLEGNLKDNHLITLPNNIFLFHGDSTDEVIHEAINQKIGIGLQDFDLFYTYLTMYEAFSHLIARKAKKGSVFMVYGLKKIIPKLDGLTLITPRPLEGILALYRKE